MQKWMTVAALAVGLGLMAAPVTAGPAGGLAGDYRAAAPSTLLAEQVARRCWWHRGERRCRRNDDRDYGEHGYGPSVNLNIGSGRHDRDHRRSDHRRDR
jgi:hypothetical protein